MKKEILHLLKFIIAKIKFSKKLKFYYSVTIGKNSKFEGANKLHPKSHFNGEIGYGSYIGKHSEIFGKIGRYSSIAPFVRVNNGLHPYKKPFVSTSPIFYSLRNQTITNFSEIQRFEELRFADVEKKFPVIIGNDCWIGENVFINGGVTIGDGAVVLAGAIVTKDIPPYSIAGGVPAKVIDYRYERDIIEKLLKIKWWSEDPKWLKENLHLMLNIDLLLQHYESKS